MKLLLAAVALSIPTMQQPAGETMTFDEALNLATIRSTPAASRTSRELAMADLRRAHLPDFRAEVGGNHSLTLDPYYTTPLQQGAVSSVLAFDYPLWDGGATAARVRSVEAKLDHVANANGMDDERYTELLNAFGDLYLAQHQADVLRPLYDRMSQDDAKTNKLLQAGEIDNLTAADRREIVLGFESRLLELEARRIDAVTKIRLLTGVEGEPRLVVDLDERAPAMTSSTASDDGVRVSTSVLNDSQWRLREVQAGAGFRVTLSGFAGLSSAQSSFQHINSNGSNGIYGLRVLLSYPLFRGSSSLAVAEARADVAQSAITQAAAINAARLRADEYRYQEQTAGRRIELLQQSVQTAKQREQSLQRLVGAGLRRESDLAQAQAERIRREIDLLAAQIDRWKAARLLSRMTTTARG